MRVDVVDPSAFTPPYDHALCAALARAGAEVELVTSEFAYGTVPAPGGYRVREAFYRGASGAAGSRGRRVRKLAAHVPDMLRYRRSAEAGGLDVAHFQWLAVQPLDVHLLPRRGPAVVLTAHDVLPREPRPGQRAAQRRLYERVDAVVVHSEHGRRRLVDELGIEPAKVEAIPHGAFTHLAELPPGPLPAELPETDAFVALHFGLLRPYKGLDVLLDAWPGAAGAELWIVGHPRMPLPSSLPAGVRLVPRFVTDAEAAALFRRADLAVLPYREIDQSGVLFTAMAFGTPLLLSDVGGFPEIPGATVVPAGDVDALAAALRGAVADPPARATAVPPEYSWDAIARRTLDLYARIPRR